MTQPTQDPAHPGSAPSSAPRLESGPPPAAADAAPLDLGPGYRARLVQQLARERYDLLVVGGGINGAGIAYDAAMRGFSVLLVEKSDFAAGTSSRSSKLIHGGIRYLKNLEFGLVFEALRERTLLLQLCPHLVRPLPFLYPVYEGDPDGKLAIAAGLWLYDLLALFRAPQRHRDLGPADMERVEPSLRREKLRSAPRYFDAWTNDARLVLATVQSAVRCGADVLPYAEVRSFLRDGERIRGAVLTDRLTGTDLAVEARLVVNAAGPWLDRVAALERPDAAPRIQPTKGVHLLVPRERLPLSNAVVLRSPDDGRMLFAIPWERMTLLGTTDTFYDGSPDEVYADAADVTYLLRAANAAFPAASLEPRDVHSTYAGLRPLITQSGKKASDISREHEIWLSPGGVLSVGGGKYTTFRAVAEEVVEQAAEQLTRDFGIVRMRRSRTDAFPLEGGALESLEQATEQLAARLDAARGPASLAPHLVRSFGTNARALVQDARREKLDLEPLVPGLPYTLAEFVYCARYEMSSRLLDLFVRRTQLHLEAPDGGLSVAERVARAVAPTLGWDSPRVDLELRLYEDEVRRTRACLQPQPSLVAPA